MEGIGVYVLISVASKVFYIGATRNIKKRKQQHLFELKHGTHWSKKIQEAYTVHPGVYWEFFPCASIEEAYLLEKKLVGEHKLDPLLSNTGAGKSQEVREKMSRAKIGYKHTPEAIAKMRASSTGLKMPPRTEAYRMAAAERAKKKINIDGVTYDCMTDAANAHGIALSTLSCRMSRDAHKWPTWQYV